MGVVNAGCVNTMMTLKTRSHVVHVIIMCARNVLKNTLHLHPLQEGIDKSLTALTST